ncbi:MAG: SDR family NAD(P)-dependent oxidoreductase [Acidobacteriota bacterium]
MKAAIAAAEEWHGGINVLVNNAAIGYKAAIEEGEEHNIRKLFETNFFGVTSTIRAALPGMRARARGTIVNISSVGGVVSVPGVGYYCASKHALEGLTDALAEEVAPLGIRVMSVEPGGFRTGIAGRNLQSPRIDAHGPTAHKIMDLLRVENESTYAPGDPVRMAEILVDLVNSGDMPERLSMGADSWMAIMAKLDVLRAGYETWKKVAYSTYFS